MNAPEQSEAEPIIRIAARGDGVTATGCHVPGAAPGDSVTASGTIIKGPHHQDAPCRHFGSCGGCQIQHVDDVALAQFVRDRVLGALASQRISVDDVAAAHLSPPQARRRVALKARKMGAKAAIGFAEEGSHRLVDIVQCPVMHPQLFALLEPLRRLLGKLMSKRDAARISLSVIDQGVDVLIEGVEAHGLDAAEALAAFGGENGLARLSLDTGDGPQSWWEPEPATVSFGGVAVAFPPYGFLQATRDGEAALLAAVAPVLNSANGWADLFCGLGTFALGLSTNPASYAAEAAREPVLALLSAARRAHVLMKCEHRDLFRRPLTPAECKNFEAVLLDPPRAGAREQIAELARSDVPHIAYVSCNPASFARDAATLIGGGYHLRTIKPVGQFRWSTHVELAALFERG